MTMTSAPTIAIVPAVAADAKVQIIPRLETGLWRIYERDAGGRERRAPTIAPQPTRRAVLKVVGVAYGGMAVMTSKGMAWFMADPDGTQEEASP